MKKIFIGLIVMFILSSNAWAEDYYAVGISYYKKENYSKASENFERAIKINPKNVNARYYLAQTYLMQKRIDDAADQYNRIIVLNPNSDAARLSMKGLSFIQESYFTKADSFNVSNSNLDQYKDNYLDYVLPGDNSLIRWASFPLKVYIEPKKQKPIAQNACKEWQTKTNNLVSFIFVNSPQNAQITIDFKDKLETSSTKESFIAGFSKPYYQGDKIIKSEIHILTFDPVTKKNVADGFIFFSTLHELGHSLGFKGHSPNKDDVMAGQTSSAKNSLTQRDINTMNLLYKIDKKTLASRNSGQTDVKLQQALDYAKSVPDKSVGWSNLGDIYRNKKMYTEAILNYKKAIAIEPNKAELYNLLGTTYSAIGDSKNSFDNLKKACDLDKTNSFYLYQFAQLCASAGQKQVGMNYVNSYLKANPQALSDEKIQELIGAYK